jgi:hypothetical protein
MLLLYNCKGTSGIHQLPNKGDAAPGKVTNVRVQNIPGGANIFYSVPKSKDLGWVKAVFTTKARGMEQVKSSRYNDNLTVAGFADNAKHTLKLYAVSQGGTPSVPVSVTIKPLMPPFLSVYHSLQVQNTFGGVHVTYDNNNTNAKLALVLIKDSSNVLVPVQTNFISKLQGSFSVRGLQAKKYKLGYYVRDKYQNHSDTTFSEFTPLFEVELNKNLFSNAKLPTDRWQNGRGAFSSIWDNADVGGTHEGVHSWFMRPGTKLPVWITINLGQLAKIDRFIFYGVPHLASFSGPDPKKFQLWGSAKPNIADSAHWQQSPSWFKLGDFKMVEPQGITPNTPYPQNGVEFNIKNPSKLPYARYLRIVCLSTFDGSNRMAIGELTLYGAPKDVSKNK